jgi:hypothetical protein
VSGIRGVRREEQAGVDGGLGGALLESLQGVDRLRQIKGAKPRDPAPVSIGEGAGAAESALQVRVDGGVGGAA